MLELVNQCKSKQWGGRRTCKSRIKFCWHLPLTLLSVRRREWEWLLKSHCASWSLETACRQSRIWLKKPNPGLTRYILRLPRSNLRILMGLITGHCPLNKPLHNMGLIGEPICNACGMEDESAFHLLYNCPSLISLRIRTFSKPILSVEEYEGASASALLWFALASGKFTVTPWFVHSYEHLFFLYCLILSVCLFVSSLIFQFFICVVHIRPDLWPTSGDFILPTFNPSTKSKQS
jgi:hypothetical protein